MPPYFVKGISYLAEEPQHVVPVYGPEAIKDNSLIVRLNGTEVPIPLRMVGTQEDPEWIAYVNVSDNPTLAYHAHHDMVNGTVRMIARNPNISVAVLLQSSKSEQFGHRVMDDVTKILDRDIPIVQLIGGTDENDIIHRSSRGLVRKTVSILSKSKGIVKYMGMEQRDHKLLQALASSNGEVIVLDDVASTIATIDSSYWLINTAMGLPEETVHPTLVIFRESIYGHNYPKDFPGIEALGDIPEFKGPLPRLK